MRQQRATALVEGIGFRCDLTFNGLDIARPVVRRMKDELLHAAGFEAGKLALNVVDEIRTGFATIRHVLTRAECEEFRVRVHPCDTRHAERFLAAPGPTRAAQHLRRHHHGHSAIIFLALRNVWLLGGGLFVALVMFFAVPLMPTHLLESRL